MKRWASVGVGDGEREARPGAGRVEGALVVPGAENSPKTSLPNGHVKRRSTSSSAQMYGAVDLVEHFAAKERSKLAFAPRRVLQLSWGFTSRSS